MRGWLWIGIAAAAVVPGLVSRFTDVSLNSGSAAVIYGLAIVSGAFLLSWASEVAELDIPRSLSISLLAIVAVLPEYAIDVYLAWTAADVPENVHLATANMTGANRLLIGIGWSLVVFLFWLQTRQKTLAISQSNSAAIVILALATAYSFTIIIKGYLHIADTVVLGALFGLYMWMSFKGKVEAPMLVGPSALIGALPPLRRRTIAGLMFVYSAVAIVVSAEPFVEGLKDTGEALDLSEFLLIQWVAPLASEAPEILLAGIFVLRGRPSDGLGILVSSKVNQWTLLVGAIPIAFAL
ncbi:MAG: sodium:calcium antiporter, partial [Dehalococcoidia bacterium]